MNRISTTIIVALFAVAALEFGIFGVSASGITGGSSDLPPIGDRGVVEATPTPAATATPAAPVSPPPQLSPPSVVAGITIIADPLAIHCDGSETARVRVRILDVNGDPAPDGIPVYFAPYNGDAEPYYAYTQDGYAETNVRFYDDIFPYGPNLFVRADLLEAGIRILCFPESDECPISPPSESPPCGPTPTPEPPVSPPPCNPSPGSDPLSPPCATPTPECQLSPPAISPPPQLSPPCGSPAFEMAIDCDLEAFGVQPYCDVAAGANVDVGVVLTNRSGSPASLAAFNVTIENQDAGALRPLLGVDDNRDGNPDFNETAFGGAVWACKPPSPSPDTNPNDGSSTSLISCFDGTASGPVIADGASMLLATVHYQADAAAQYAYTYLSLIEAAVYDTSFTELGSCNYTINVLMQCNGANINIYQPAGPSALDIQADCDLSSDGIQLACSVPASGGPHDVDVYVVNNSSDDVTLSSFYFMLRDNDTSRFVPRTGLDYNLNANPDFVAVPEPNTWVCLPPVPQPDSGFFGPGNASSTIGCYDGAQIVPAVVPAGGALRVVTVHYDIPEDAEPGEVEFSFSQTQVYDVTYNTRGTCEDIIYEPQMLCPTTTITLVQAATPTPPPTNTPVPPTATNTPAGPRCADVNGSGRVNMFDVFRVFAKVRAGVYDERYDINRDGKLTMADVRAAYQQRGDRCRN